MSTKEQKTKKLNAIMEPIEETIKKYEFEIQSLRESPNHDFNLLDDVLLYRFLKGNNFNVSQAAIHLQRVLDMRKTNGLDEIREKAVKITQKDFPLYDRVVRCHPHVVNHGVDRHGQPLSIEKIGSLDADLLGRTLSYEDLLTYHRYHLENKAAQVANLSSKTGHIIRTCKIMDLKGLGMHHLKPKGLTLFRKVIHWMQDCYPEMLGQLFVINAPVAFQTLWKIIKPWLNESTQSKIVFVPEKDTKQVLVHAIDPKYLPIEYGGTCQCPGGCVPIIAANAGFTEVEIKAGKKHEEIIHVQKGDTVAWEFRTKKNDICFSGSWLRCDMSPDAGVLFIQPVRVLSDEQLVTGKVTVDGAGIITLRWDNFHSSFTAKQLLFRITKTDKASDSEDDDEKDNDLKEIGTLGNNTKSDDVKVESAADTKETLVANTLDDRFEIGKKQQPSLVITITDFD